jgi:hypothetical protein
MQPASSQQVNSTATSGVRSFPDPIDAQRCQSGEAQSSAGLAQVETVGLQQSAQQHSSTCWSAHMLDELHT